MKKMIFYRIYPLLWADILVFYALFVMQNYLTEVWNLSLTHAAAILNIWNGMSRILPFFFLYLVDSFLGHFKPLLLFTTISYSIGIVFVFLSLPPILAKPTHTCKGYKPECIARAEEGFLYGGLALIAIGAAGNFVGYKRFYRRQLKQEILDFLDDINALFDKLGHHLKHIVVGQVGAVIVAVFGKTIPYIRQWTLRFGIPAIFTVLSTIWFIMGCSDYENAPGNPKRSPVCTLCRVIVSAVFKMCRPYPPDDTPGYLGIEKVKFSKTSCLRGLHKGAIKLGDGDNIKGWKLCSTEEVEDAKLVVRMMPLWITFIVCGIISSTGDTYFVEQAGKLDRHIGTLKLPVEVLLLARAWLSHLFEYIVEVQRSAMINGRNNVPFYGMIFAMVCSVLCCISAAGTERMRLQVVTRNGLLDKANEAIPMSMYWLLFQFVLLGGLDTILLTSANAYYTHPHGYYGYEPDRSMKAFLESCGVAMFGLGFISSSLSVYVVGRISERGGRPNWFQDTLNKSRLDRYYWVLAALTSVNLVVFVVIALRYMYKNKEVRRRRELEEAHGGRHRMSLLDAFESWVR